MTMRNNRPKVGQQLYFEDLGVLTVKDRGRFKRGKIRKLDVSADSLYSIMEDCNGNIVMGKNGNPIWFYDEFLTEENFI